jgi:uncharacterized Zn finger protein
MARETAFDKARRLLTEGRILVRRASQELLVAQVRGDSAHVYRAGFERSWFCSCDHSAQTTKCSHILALMLVWIEPESES